VFKTFSIRRRKRKGKKRCATFKRSLNVPLLLSHYKWEWEGKRLYYTLGQLS